MRDPSLSVNRAAMTQKMAKDGCEEFHGNYNYFMAASLENLASEALRLPKDQRLTLAHRILASVEPGSNPEVEAAWDEEIRERIRRYDAGLAAGIPGSEVFAELDKKLKG